MKRLQIKMSALGIRHNHNDCICCGLNTNLLEENESVVIPEKNERGIVVGYKKYCRHCYEEGLNKKHVTSYDFYIDYFPPNISVEESRRQTDFRMACTRKCQELHGIEIAHLCGGKGEESEMHLDMFFDKESGEMYFRVTICNNDDPWFGTELRNYISPERTIELLNKNDIHILDGLTTENWKEYFAFLE